MTLEELRQRKGEILHVVAKHGGKPEVRVFGSIARGDTRPGSDIDLLVELEPGRSILDRAELQIELEKLLGQKVDALSPRGLYSAVRDGILGEAVPL